MKKILISALAIVAMVSCSQSPLKEDTGELPNKQITVQSNVVQSKAIALNSSEIDLNYIRDDKATQDWTGALQNVTRAANGNIPFVDENYKKDNTNSYFKFFSTGGVVTETTKYTWTPSGSEDIVYTASAWDAGKYTAPVVDGLNLDHMLTRVEVVIEAADGAELDVVKKYWGEITGIKIAGLPSTVTYDAAAADAAAFTYGAETDKTSAKALLAGDAYTGSFASAEIAAKGTGTVVAGAMLPSGSGITSAKLYISTATITDQEVGVTFLQAIEKGKINTITLSFSAQNQPITVTSTVKGWAGGTTGSGSL